MAKKLDEMTHAGLLKKHRNIIDAIERAKAWNPEAPSNPQEIDNRIEKEGVLECLGSELGKINQCLQKYQPELALEFAETQSPGETNET